MTPKFANPHSLSQDVERTTRSEIAERVGLTFTVRDESLKRDLDTTLRDTWADALVHTSSLSSAKKFRNIAEGCKTENGQLVFRLISSMKRPQHISLDPKPPLPSISREHDCEDDKAQAETRKIRSLSVAVEFESLGDAASSVKQNLPKKLTDVRAGTSLAGVPLAGPLPSLLVTEEARAGRTVGRDRQASGSFAASPHEPRPTCVVLPVTSVPSQRGLSGEKRRKRVKERPAPAYWRPSPELRGKCMGYALGYPSSWAPDRPYVRDAMKRGVETCHAVHDHP